MYPYAPFVEPLALAQQKGLFSSALPFLSLTTRAEKPIIILEQFQFGGFYDKIRTSHSTNCRILRLPYDGRSDFHSTAADLTDQLQQLADFFTAAAPAAPQNTLEEKAALQLAEGAETDGLYRLMTALAKPARLVNEDLLRESGYMLPQSKNARDLLEK